MNVYKINNKNAQGVSTLMVRIKPAWWPAFSNAYKQLTDVEEGIDTVGWFLGTDEDHPVGWVLCRELKGYRSIELECCGYDDEGVFKLEHKLRELFDTIAAYGKAKGYTTFRTSMSTVGFCIDGKAIDDIPAALKSLKTNRVDYQWLLAYGFRVIGLLPNAYGDNCHLIMFAKGL